MNEAVSARAVRPPDPVLMGAFDEKGHGRWNAGGIPDGSTLPVIVFVHGLGGYAAAFWQETRPYGLNDMYMRALYDGFRTAYVSFAADDEKPADMWHNGKLFAWQLEEICRFFRVENVVVVAHSKGGVDAQAAALYFGAAPRIRKLITLSTPHWGSQLADLAYSTFGWDLAERLGQHSDGCYCMQTAYMGAFRRAAEQKAPLPAEIETFAGNGDAPAFTGLWAGSGFLSAFGENDGVVTVHSAHNPAAKHLGTLPFNHVQMFFGQNVWENLRGAVLGEGAAAGDEAAAGAAACGTIYRGGRLDNGVADEFPVDTTVESMNIEIALTGEDDVDWEKEAQLFAPDGTPYHNLKLAENLPNMRALQARVDAPQKGMWHILLPARKGAYLTQIRLGGTFCAFPAEAAGNTLLQQEAKGKVSTVLRVVQTFANRIEMYGEQRMDPGAYRPPLRLGDGSFTLESVVKGILEDGSPFERTVLRPVLLGAAEAFKIALAGVIGTALS